MLFKTCLSFRCLNNLSSGCLVKMHAEKSQWPTLFKRLDSNLGKIRHSQNIFPPVRVPIQLLWLFVAFNQTACVILHRVYNFTQFFSRFEFSNGSLICLDAWQLLSPIYALSSVRFPGLKLWLCKKDDKYEVTLFIKHHVFFNK